MEYGPAHTATADTILLYTGPKCYYWLVYTNGQREFDLTTDIHPFQYMSELNSHPMISMFYTLLNWKPIDVDEYNLAQQLSQLK